MANYVTIGLLGSRPPAFGLDALPAQAVAGMIEFWKKKLDQLLPDKPDLILVPEVCDRPSDGYPPERLQNYYRTRGNRVRDFFARVAADNSSYVVYSAVRELPDRTWRNSMQILDRKGSLAGVYDKVHPVVEETTETGCLPGRTAGLIECDFGKVACAICFDLNFDDLRLEYARLRPDLILFSSNYHGGLMQGVWAYSCRAHFAGAIGGRDKPSGVLSPLGELLARNTNYQDFVTARINLDCRIAHLDYNWDKLAALKKKYGRGVRISDPGLLGCVQISSELDTVTAARMVSEFQIELLDEYMSRALNFQRAHGAWRPG